MFRWFKKHHDIGTLLAVLIASSIGLVAAFVLSYEALVLTGNKNAVLSCDINAVLSCGSVANHWSATLFAGIPNSFFGMMAMPVVMTIAVVLLTGAKLPRWFMQATQIGALLGLVFAAWMFYMSFAVIGVLCPWCLITDVVIVVIAFGVTRYNVLNGFIKSSSSVKKFFERQYDWLVAASVIVAMVVGILAKYGSSLFV